VPPISILIVAIHVDKSIKVDFIFLLKKFKKL
jgi:hypothetical protein